MNEGEGLFSAAALDKPISADENAAVVAAGRKRETHMGFVRTIATICFVVALPIALLTTNIRLLANAPLTYRYAFDRYDAQAATALSRGDHDSTTGSSLNTFHYDSATSNHQTPERS